jgi:hypothetical protein
VADTAANDQAFGRPGTHRGESGGAFPQLRMVALAECGTHAVVDAELDGCRVGRSRWPLGWCGRPARGC